MTRRLPLLTFALVGVALLLAGCAANMPGTAIPDPASARLMNTPLTAQAVFGDYTTVNYCGLLNPPGLVQAGGVGPSAPLPSFSSCTINVTVNGGSVSVELGFLDAPPEAQRSDRVSVESLKLSRGMSVGRNKRPLANSCFYYLNFPDGVSLRAGAVSDSTGQVSDEARCRLAEAAVLDASEVAISGRITHFALPNNSLGKMDTCALLSSEQVATELGIASLTQISFPGKHECQWQQRDLFTVVNVFVFLANPARLSEGKTEETLAGKRSLVRDQNDFCAVFVGNGPSAAGRSDDVELAAISVVSGQTGKDDCAVARSLANIVWPKLPAA